MQEGSLENALTSTAPSSGFGRTLFSSSSRSVCSLVPGSGAPRGHVLPKLLNPGQHRAKAAAGLTLSTLLLYGLLSILQWQEIIYFVFLKVV